MRHKLVRDLLLPLTDYVTVFADTTLKEALECLSEAQNHVSPSQHFHRAVLVMDEGGAAIGKLSHWAILRSLEPRLLRYEDEASLARAGLTDDFISSLRRSVSSLGHDLEHMCRAAGQLKAREIMVPVTESIEDDAPLTDAIHLMVVKRVQSVLVTCRGRVIGILRQTDVFEEVAAMIREEDDRLTSDGRSTQSG